MTLQRFSSKPFLAYKERIRLQSDLERLYDKFKHATNINSEILNEFSVIISQITSGKLMQKESQLLTQLITFLIKRIQLYNLILILDEIHLMPVLEDKNIARQIILKWHRNRTNLELNSAFKIANVALRFDKKLCFLSMIQEDVKCIEDLFLCMGQELLESDDPYNLKTCQIILLNWSEQIRLPNSLYESVSYFLYCISLYYWNHISASIINFKSNPIDLKLFEKSLLFQRVLAKDNVIGSKFLFKSEILVADFCYLTTSFIEEHAHRLPASIMALRLLNICLQFLPRKRLETTQRLLDQRKKFSLLQHLKQIDVQYLIKTLLLPRSEIYQLLSISSAIGSFKQSTSYKSNIIILKNILVFVIKAFLKNLHLSQAKNLETILITILKNFKHEYSDQDIFEFLSYLFSKRYFCLLEDALAAKCILRKAKIGFLSNCDLSKAPFRIVLLYFLWVPSHPRILQGFQIDFIQQLTLIEHMTKQQETLFDSRIDSFLNFSFEKITTSLSNSQVTIKKNTVIIITKLFRRCSSLLCFFPKLFCFIAQSIEEFSIRSHPIDMVEFSSLSGYLRIMEIASLRNSYKTILLEDTKFFSNLLDLYDKINSTCKTVLVSLLANLFYIVDYNEEILGSLERTFHILESKLVSLFEHTAYTEKLLCQLVRLLFNTLAAGNPNNSSRMLEQSILLFNQSTKNKLRWNFFQGHLYINDLRAQYSQRNLKDSVWHNHLDLIYPNTIMILAETKEPNYKLQFTIIKLFLEDLFSPLQKAKAISVAQEAIKEDITSIKFSPRDHIIYLKYKALIGSLVSNKG